MTSFKAPLSYNLHPQNTGQASEFAGMPVGMELLTRYYIFDPFHNVSLVTVPNATAATLGLDWTTTAVGASTFDASDDLAPPRVIVVTAGAENDGAQAQYTAASGAGEFFDLRQGKIRYFGCQFILSDANNNLATVQQSDLFLGLAITDTTVLGGATDFIGFHKIDGSGVVNFVAGKNAGAAGLLVDQIVQPTGVVLTAADAGTSIAAGDTAQVGAFHSFSFTAINNDVVMIHADGRHVSTVRSTTQLPDDEQLCPTIAYLTGEAVAKGLSITKFIVASEL